MFSFLSLCFYYSYRSLEKHSICVRRQAQQDEDKEDEEDEEDEEEEDEEDTPKPEVHSTNSCVGV